jgi:hypothetical protein
MCTEVDADRIEHLRLMSKSADDEPSELHITLKKKSANEEPPDTRPSGLKWTNFRGL